MSESVSKPACPRKTPCASCPYRQNAPSGLWHEDEYNKLPAYDEPTYAQPVNAFFCHHDDHSVCSGWLGYSDPTELLAVRIGVSAGLLSPECFDYTTPADLFASGAEAAEHGMREIADRSFRAKEAAHKLIRLRQIHAGDEVAE